jgi:hypothetical protein
VLAGVPLLLGSLYGSDMLQAALAAAATTAASPSTTTSSSSIVLADQHHDLTMERFKALAGGGSALSQIGLLLASLLPGGIAHAEAITKPQYTQQTESSSSSSSGGGEALTSAGAIPQQQLPSAFSIAAGRLLHLCLHWWSMALCSQADWYGQHLHPVFLLPNDAQLQLRLQQHGVQGVPQATAAAGRLLEAASAGALPAAEDLTAVRQFAASLEKVQRDVHSDGEVHSEAVLLPIRPWWMKLSQKFIGSLMADSSSSSVQSCSDVQQQPQQHHANHTAALAFERAVMAERNAVLTDALWEQADAAAAATHSAAVSSSSSSSWFSTAVSSIWASADTTTAAAAAAAPAAVLGVVGVNHLPGILQEWKQRKQQWHAQQQATSSSTSSSCDYASLQYAEAGQQLHQHAVLHLAATDAAAGVLEMFAVGTMGLAYLTAVVKITQPSAAAAAAAAARSASAAAAAGHWGGQQMPLGSAGKLPYGFAAAGAAAAAGGAAPCAARSAHSATITPSSSSSSVGPSWLLGSLSRTAIHSSSSQPTPLAQPTPANAAAAAPSAARVWRSGASRMRASHHLARLGLLLLPVGVALLPLQRDAGRFQEASKLLHSIAVVNDEMMSQGQLGSGMASLFELVGAVSRGNAAAV